MVMRKLASILIRDGWTCVRGSGYTFPLWNPDSHLEYILKGNFSDIIVASDNIDELLGLDTRCDANLVAALGWSGVSHIQRLFEAGYSKIFFGGVARQFPNHKEAEAFTEMVRLYGASSFGYTLHFETNIPNLTEIFLDQFNEILLVHDALQIQVDLEKTKKLARSIDSLINHQTHELNLCAPSANHDIWVQTTNQLINYVNYCEHAMARLR